MDVESLDTAEFRLGFTRLNAAVRPPNFGSPGPTELLGIPNLPNDPGFNGGWPKFLFDGMDAFGRHTSTPQFQIPNVYVFNNTWIRQRGRHSIRAGYEKLTNTVSSAECGVNCQLGSAERGQRADVVTGQTITADSPNNFRWFNTGAYRPAATPYGTAGRGTVYGPGLINWDFTVAKSFQFTERFRLQFRTEFFNAFNQVNLDQPNTNVSSGTFGVITSALPGRSIQLGLKLYF